MATLTATLFANTPKGIHAGVNAVSVQYNFGAATASAGDIVFLAKIPNGARIVEFIEDHSTGATSHAVSFGLAKGGPGGSATHSLLIASGAQAAKNRLSVLGLPPVVSVSDGEAEKWGILSAKIAEGGTATVSLVINVTCLYVTDGIT